MFNFQKEVVLNDFVLHVNNHNTETGKPANFVIEHVGSYELENIVDGAIYKTSPVEGSAFSLVLDCTSLVGKHIQVLIELGLDKNYRGDYASAQWRFRKPMLVNIDLTSVTVAAEAAALIAKALEAIMPATYKFVKVAVSGANVTITGVDTYQNVSKLNISEVTCIENCAGSEEGLVKIADLDSAIVTYTKNVAERGTYDVLLHNLRLPTSANYRFNSPMEIEMPQKGVKYVQYSFDYLVPRRYVGGVSVAGQAVSSITTHTFYVPEGKVADFEKINGATNGADPADTEWAEIFKPV